jgi:hypothetical protein
MRVLSSAVEDLDSARLALLAIAQDSDPEFFGIDLHGIPVDDDQADAGIEGRVIDYRLAGERLRLLQDRGLTILDQPAVEAHTPQEPGPVYHDGLDCDEMGQTWEQRGGPWADRLILALTRQGAIGLPDDRQ